jgi:hypothetical protein
MNATAYNPGVTGGRREDLRNVLTVLEPQETPFVSRVRKGPAPKSTLVETLGDTLRKPKRVGTKEGTDAERGANKAKDRARFGVYIHRSLESYGVSDVQQIISQNGGQAAVDDEFGKAKSKTLLEMKRDMEAICLGDQEDSGGTSEADMTTRGAFKWIQSTAQSSNPVPELFRTPSGAIVSGKSFAGTRFTEDDLNGVLKALRAVYGGKRTYMGLGGGNAIDTVDHFTRVETSNNTRYKVQEMADEHEITMMVNVFESSFGRVEFMTDDFIKTSATTGEADAEAFLILNPDLWHIDMFDDLHAVDEDETAGGHNGWAKMMFANMCDSPKGHGKIFNS